MVAISSEKDKYQRNWRRFDGTSERKELSSFDFKPKLLSFCLKPFAAFGAI